MTIPDRGGLTPVEKLVGQTPAETDALRQLAADAEAFLKGFGWCRDVLASYSGIAVPGVVGVFLHHIQPTEAQVDDWLWTVVGDLPPAYLVTDEARTPDEALEAYIGEMRTWVDAVRMGQPTEELIPVNVPPTQEYAAMLDSRLRLLEEHLEGEDEESG
jgi:hypothetical protein